MASSDRQNDKPQRGRPKRAELPDVNINTGAQSINTERVSIQMSFQASEKSAANDVCGLHLSTICVDQMETVDTLT